MSTDLANPTDSPAEPQVRKLSREERITYDLLFDKNLFGKSVPEKCQTRTRSGRPFPVASFHTALQDPWFQNHVIMACKGQTLERLPEVLNALVESAIREGREGQADRKLLLQMLGMAESSTPQGKRNKKAEAEKQIADAGNKLATAIENATAAATKLRAEAKKTKTPGDNAKPIVIDQDTEMEMASQ